MTYQPKILAFAGSLRRDSFNKKAVRTAAEGARAAGAEVNFIDLKDFPVPVYDGDLEAEEGLPEAAFALQELLLAHDGLLIASPEYNSGISSSLKTYLDWTSRPRGKQRAGDCYHGKTVVLMAASPGALGGIRGLPQARSILGAMGALVLPEDFALGRAHEAFDEQGAAKDERVRARLEHLGKTLAEFLIKLNG